MLEGRIFSMKEVNESTSLMERKRCVIETLRGEENPSSKIRPVRI